MGPEISSNDAPVDAAAGMPEAAGSEGISHVIAGILFAAAGVVALVSGFGYEAGSAFRMGPGYFPRLLSGGLILIGILTVLKGRRLDGWRLPSIPWRPLALILLAILVFGIVVEEAGLFIATAVTALIAGIAQPVLNWRRMTAVTVLLPIFCAVVFGYLLKLSIPVWPG